MGSAAVSAAVFGVPPKSPSPSEGQTQRKFAPCTFLRTTAFQPNRRSLPEDRRRQRRQSVPLPARTVPPTAGTVPRLSHIFPTLLRAPSGKFHLIFRRKVPVIPHF